MRYLHYTNYLSGGSGLSNGIMSIEVGVVLAHLTNRLLVLEGNNPPPANIVAYDGRVDNGKPSRITDLLDLPLPWVEPDAVDLEGLPSLELTNLSLGDFAFYFPKTLDLSTDDARSFARDRKHWLSVSGVYDDIHVLRLSEAPLVPGTTRHRSNLGWYGYQFYLDDETRRSVYRLLQRLQAKRPFAELAKRVARDIGPFNAVHMRRGDFKVTYGVTTLDRKPSEAIEAMDQLFGRKDPLVIVTDERDDPFFLEIKLAYPNHHFIDWHILDNYGAEFAALPRSDSLSLAHLSQLVAAESKEFIGTMTSTFTALIQRYRGNRGKDEAFRYLWNELPETYKGVERGRHAVSDCIPLDRGQMIEQFSGRYSWNRVSQLLNPAWMREWPESFLLPEVLASGALLTTPQATQAAVAPYVAPASFSPVLYVPFEDLQIAIRFKDAAVMKRVAPELGAQAGTEARNVIANFEVSTTAEGYGIGLRGRDGTTFCDKAELPVVLKQQLGSAFALVRHNYTWLAAAAFAKEGRGLAVVGDMDDRSGSFRRALELSGWELLDAALFAIRIEDLVIVPLGAQAQPAGGTAKGRRVSTPLETIVIARRAPLHLKGTSLAPLSPATAVAALIGASLDFQVEQHRAVQSLCRVVEKRPAAQVHFNSPQDAAQAISRWADALSKVAA